jgi:hypothetical protein
MMIEKGLKMTEFETQCYGISEEDIREEYINGITGRIAGLEMVVMGILSDAQHMIEADYFTDDHVRKQLNIAKFILSEMMDAKRKETV